MLWRDALPKVADLSPAEIVRGAQHALDDTRYVTHTVSMIRSFACKDTERPFNGGKCPRHWKAFASVAKRKLDMVDAAATLTDLRLPPGNRLGKLGGDRKGQNSIRINDQWRVCFRWADGGAEDVEIVDYH